MKTLMKGLVMLAAVAVLVVVARAYLRPIGADLLTAGAANACGPLADGAIVESGEFTPYVLQRSKPFNGSLVESGMEDPSIPTQARLGEESIDGHARRHTIATDAGAVYAYFLNREMGSLKRSDFMALGGIELSQDPADRADPFVPYLLDFLGERAVSVDVGPFAGALTWADPDENGLRTHNVYWSDGDYNYSLIADRSAAEATTLARSLAC